MLPPLIAFPHVIYTTYTTSPLVFVGLSIIYQVVHKTQTLSLYDIQLIIDSDNVMKTKNEQMFLPLCVNTCLLWSLILIIGNNVITVCYTNIV